MAAARRWFVGLLFSVITILLAQRDAEGCWRRGRCGGRPVHIVSCPPCYSQPPIWLPCPLIPCPDGARSPEEEAARAALTRTRQTTEPKVPNRVCVY
jgi:hypothetical protein